jgi:hypothetical protein
MKIRYIIILLLILIIGGADLTSAQSTVAAEPKVALKHAVLKIQLSGKISDEKHHPAAYATVSLLQKDSSLVKNVLSDTAGIYLFHDTEPGNYLLRVSLMGYQSFYSQPFELTPSMPLEKLPLIILVPESNQLKNVTVTSRKPLIEQKIDRTVMNVENSIIGSGNSILELLEKAPGVSVDRQNELIKLNNKAGVLIMIDGKKSYLSGPDLNNYLRGLRSEQVATIEIITNPSSKYDASGNAGIINIRLKKNLSYGTNGSIAASGSTAFVNGAPDDVFNGNINLNLNHRTANWNIYGNAGSFRDADFNELKLDRQINHEGQDSRFNQLFYKPRTGSGITGKLGADYYISEKTTAGIMLDAGKWDGKLISDSRTSVNELQSGTSTSLVQRSLAMTPRNNITANFNLKHEFNKKGMELVFDADYSRFHNRRDQNFDTDFLDRDGNISSNLVQRNNTLTKIDIYAAQADLTLPLANKLKIETGLKTGNVKTDNDFDVAQFTSSTWQNDPLQSNTFLYKETIHAGYINLAKEWNKWSVQAGVRAEYTRSTGTSPTTSQVTKNNYLSIFPTIFIRQVINPDNSLHYAYGRRIDRPNYQQLNPFVFFLDPYTLETGNPYLKPQFTDNMEISYTYKSSATLSIHYSHTSDYILNVTQQNDSTRIISVGSGNIGDYKNLSANLSFPVKVNNWWTMQNQVSGYYNRFSDQNLQGGQLSNGKFAYNFYTSSSFNLSETWSAELNMWYNSPNVYGIDVGTRAMYAVNAGVQKKLMQDKARLKLNVNDLLYSSYYEGLVSYQNIYFTVMNRQATRRVNISFSYNFGNQKLKSAPDRNTATEELKQRVKAGN